MIHVNSEQTVLKDMLAALSDAVVPLSKTFVVSWGPNNARRPLQEVLDIFWKRLGTDESPAAIFKRSGRQIGTSFLQSAPSVSVTLEGSSTAWKLATGLLALMAPRVQLGLKASSNCPFNEGTHVVQYHAYKQDQHRFISCKMLIFQCDVVMLAVLLLAMLL